MSGKEQELCWFIEILDFSGLTEADNMEHHLQYEYRLPPGEDGSRRGRVRVRKTTRQDEVKYDETLKVPLDAGSMGDQEHPVDITEDYFKAWVATFKPTGQSKTRYTFVSKQVELLINGEAKSLPPVKLEIDVFLNSQGQRMKFAKLDVEVQDIIAYVKDHPEDISKVDFSVNVNSLPVKVGRIVSAVTQDPEEKTALVNFYKKIEITPE